MTTSERNALETAADHLDNLNPALAHSLRLLANQNASGPCSFCRGKVGLKLHDLYGSFLAYRVHVHLESTDNNFICLECAQRQLNELNANLLKQ